MTLEVKKERDKTEVFSAQFPRAEQNNMFSSSLKPKSSRQGSFFETEQEEATKVWCRVLRGQLQTAQDQFPLPPLTGIMYVLAQVSESLRAWFSPSMKSGP